MRAKLRLIAFLACAIMLSVWPGRALADLFPADGWSGAMPVSQVATPAQPAQPVVPLAVVPAAKPAVQAPRPVLSAKPVATVREAPRLRPPSKLPSGETVEVGVASFDSDGPGHCAHKEPMPYGTVIHVVNTDNGRSTSCVVNDHGPYVDGRVVDLDKSVFAQIANPRDGLANVRISYNKTW